MIKKTKIYILLSIVVASAIAGTVSVSRPASAQSDTTGNASLYISPRLEHDLIGAQWREAMIRCLSSPGSSALPVTNEDLRAGRWFNYDDKQNVSYLIDSSDGRYQCNEGDNGSTFVNAFIEAYGWENPFVAACELGYRPTNSRDSCIDSDGSGQVYTFRANANSDTDGSRKVLNEKYPYIGDGGGLGNVQRYVLYMRTFQRACNPSDPTSSIGTGDASLYSTGVGVVDGKGNVSTVYYKLNDKTSKKHVSVDYTNGNEELTCAELAEKLAPNSPVTSAYSFWVEDQELSPEAIDEGTDRVDSSPNFGSTGSKSTCQIEGIGWLVCPVLTFLATATDSVYSVLDRVFLRLPPVNMDLDDNTNGLYRSWRAMRDIANIVFVVAFLLIVFSQVTSMGISNYGLKRLIPKLIVSAILVNTSYFICAVAVDISNIIGSSLKDLLDNASGGVLSEASETAWNNGGGFRSIVSTALITVGAGVALATWATLPMVGIVILFVLPIVVTVLITMVVRQAIVVLLITLSPLAFVALLLPNTEGLYKKWQGLFNAMLLLYPIVALVFGASALASTVLMAAAQDAGGMATLHGIAAAAVRVLPLLFIPTLMKISSGVFGRLTGIVNDKQKGWFDNFRNTRAENHQYDLAQRARERSNNPNRIRAFDRFTPLGSAVRAEDRKTRAKETEDIFRSAYLQTERGRESYRAAGDTKSGLEGIQTALESVRLGDRDSQNLEIIAKNAQARLDNVKTGIETRRLGEREGRDHYIAAARLDTEKQIVDKQLERVATQHQDIDRVTLLEEQKLGAEEAQHDLARDVAPRVSMDVRSDTREAELEREAAETTAQSVVSRRMAGTAADRAHRRSQLELQAADTGAEADWSGQTIDNPALRTLTQEVQVNQAAIGVAQGVAGRRFSESVAAGGADIENALGVASMHAGSATDTRTAVATAVSEAAEREVRRAQPALQDRLARLAPQDRDAEMLRSARDARSSPFERAAANREIVARQRDNLIVELQNIANPDNTAVDQVGLQQELASNSSAIIGKAPDLIKGPSGAFNDMKSEELVAYSNFAVGRAMNHLSNLKTRSTSAGATADDIDTYDRALSSFKNAFSEIGASIDLQKSFRGDAGREIIASTSTGAPASNIADDIDDELTILKSNNGRIK